MIILSSRFVSGCMLEMPTPPVFFLLQPSTATRSGICSWPGALGPMQSVRLSTDTDSRRVDTSAAGALEEDVGWRPVEADAH